MIVLFLGFPLWFPASLPSVSSNLRLQDNKASTFCSWSRSYVSECTVNKAANLQSSYSAVLSFKGRLLSGFCLLFVGRKTLRSLPGTHTLAIWSIWEAYVQILSLIFSVVLWYSYFWGFLLNSQLILHSWTLLSATLSMWGCGSLLLWLWCWDLLLECQVRQPPAVNSMLPFLVFQR